MCYSGRLIYFMLALIPQSGDFSGAALGVRSVALLQVPKPTENLKKEKQQSLTIRQAIVDIFLITVSLLTSCSFLEGDSVGFAIEGEEILPLGL